MEQATFDALMVLVIATGIVGTLGGYFFGLTAGKVSRQAANENLQLIADSLKEQLAQEREAVYRACDHNHKLRTANDELGQKLKDLATENSLNRQHLRRAADLEQMIESIKQAHASDQEDHQQHIQQLQDRAVELNKKLEQATEAQGTLTAIKAYAQLLRDTARRWHPDLELQRKLKPQEVLDHRACLKELADIVEGKAMAVMEEAA